MGKFITYYAINPKRKCWYVGYSARGLKRRKKEHYYCCFQQKQFYKFYNFLRKYEKNFIWKIIEHYNTEEKMKQGEMNQIKIYKKKYKDWECLNVNDGGEGGDNFTNNPNKEKIRERIRKSLNNFYKTSEGKEKQKKQSEKKKHFYLTLEGKKLAKKHSEKLKGKFIGKDNPNYGNHKLAGKNNPRWGKEGYWAGKRGPWAGKKRPDISKRMSDKGNPWFGKKRPDISKRMTGPKNPRAREVILISPGGVPHRMKSYKPFCKKYKLNPGHICEVLKEKLPHHKGWTGYYLDKK